MARLYIHQVYIIGLAPLMEYPGDELRTIVAMYVLGLSHGTEHNIVDLDIPNSRQRAVAPLSNALTALTFSLSECFDFFISFGFWCYKNIIFCPLFNRPIFGDVYIFGEGHQKGMFTFPPH